MSQNPKYSLVSPLTIILSKILKFLSFSVFSLLPWLHPYICFQSNSIFYYTFFFFYQIIHTHTYIFTFILCAERKKYYGLYLISSLSIIGDKSRISYNYTNQYLPPKKTQTISFYCKISKQYIYITFKIKIKG